MVRVLVLVLWEQARVKNMELAEIREIFGRRRRTPASADADVCLVLVQFSKENRKVELVFSKF